MVDRPRLLHQRRDGADTGGMNTRTPGLTYAAATAVGIATWAGAAIATHPRPGWDDDLYVTVVLPVIGLCALALGASIPERAWRGALAPFAGEAAAAMVFAFFGAAACIPACIGAAVGRRLRGNRPGSGSAHHKTSDGIPDRTTAPPSRTTMRPANRAASPRSCAT